MKSNWNKFVAPISFLILAGSLVVSPCTAQEKPPFQDNQLSALFSPAVLKDLELVDDQKQDLKAIMDDIKSYRSDLIADLKEHSKSGASKSDVEAKRQEAIRKIEEKKSATLKQVNNVLLPHQQRRLRQSTVQVMMQQTAKQQKLDSGLLTPQMLTYLEIDDEQAAEIREEVKKLRAELAEKIRKLNQQATDKLLEQLSSSQRKKYQELIGDRVKNLK